MVPANIAILLNDFGVNNALTKYIAQYRYEGKNRVRKLLEAGFIFNLVSMTLSAALLFYLSNHIAVRFLNNPGLSPLVRAASLYVFGEGLLTMAQAVFVGYDRMDIRVINQVFWAFFKSFTPPLLVWLGYGPFGAVLGNSIAVIVSGIFGVLVVLLFARTEKPGDDFSLLSALKLITVYGFPLYLGTVAVGGLQQLYSVLMTLYIDLEKIGNYYAAINFGVVVNLFIVPLSTALFPLFSKMNNRREALGPLFQRAVKYTSILTVPITLALILLSDSIVEIIYPVGFSYTPLYMKYYLVMFLFQGVGSLAVGSLLNGIGETQVTLRMRLISILLGVPLSLLLIPRYEILGMLTTMVIAPRAGLIYGLYWIKKNLGFGFDTRSSLSIYISAIIATLVSVVPVHLLQFNNIYTILLTLPLFFLLYCILVLLTGGLVKNDLKELSSISGFLGPLKPLISILIDVASTICRY
jgi:O-antigen/teichoic acid export membrane protein